jgi:hypothetical protein
MPPPPATYENESGKYGGGGYVMRLDAYSMSALASALSILAYVPCR